jgi:tetratricopeptide (TPR) repeat protein
MGNWNRAEEALNRVASSGQRMLYLAAAVNYFKMAGLWQKALEHAETWLRERPHNTEARRQYLDLFKKKEGGVKALDLARTWMEEFRDDEVFEGIYYDELKFHYKTDEQEAHTRKRIDRNPFDIWGWHELGFLLLARANLKSGADRIKVLSEMQDVFDRLGIIAPDHVVTHVMHGDYHSSLKVFKTAVEHYFKALDDDPAYSYCYSRIWGASTTFTEADQQDVLERLERIIIRTVGFLHHARNLVFNIAERFGAKDAEQRVARWSEMKPEDPELIEARVDLLLNYGQGTSDARKAADLLEDRKSVV